VIAIEIEFLVGRYIASRFNQRDAAEWPPHPARLFSTLLATAKEHEEISEAARRALQWLEQQGAPQVLASDAHPRAVVTVYVPENTTRILPSSSTQEDRLEQARATVAEAERSGDLSVVKRAQRQLVNAEKRLDEQLEKIVADDGRYSASNFKEAIQMLPHRRGKQPRVLPSVTPEQPRVCYLWPDAAPDRTTAESLSDLSLRVVRLGHSSSLVACRTTFDPVHIKSSEALLNNQWQPVSEGGNTMRTIEHGQVAKLERAFERHQGVHPRVLPAVDQAYRKAGEGVASESARSIFGEWIVFREAPREGARRLGIRLQRTEDVTRAVRGAMLHHAEDAPPAVLSGHTPDGRPLDRPHVAFVTLADVASRYSSGSILGVAVLLPREIEEHERRVVLQAIAHWEACGLELKLGRAGVLRLERIIDRDPRSTLDPATWTRPSKRWASVTPVALDKNPGNLFSRDPQEVAEAARCAETIVGESCERIGLQRPKWVEIVRRSLFSAAPAAREFAPFPKVEGKNGSLRRVCVHVEMRFDKPVAGPVLIGAGRYFGVGLCRERPGW
jgi:CRISPR-associated protein Csb2